MSKGETAMKMGLKEARGGSKAPLGEGGRFRALEGKLGHREGVKNPRALAAWIGRRKYGGAKMAKMSAAGRRAG